MSRFSIVVSAVGVLLGVLEIAFAVYADANNGCENGPCGSPLVLAIPGGLMVAVCGGLGLYQVRKQRRSNPRQK